MHETKGSILLKENSDTMIRKVITKKVIRYIPLYEKKANYFNENPERVKAL